MHTVVECISVVMHIVLYCIKVFLLGTKHKADPKLILVYYSNNVIHQADIAKL